MGRTGCSIHPKCDRTQTDLQNDMHYVVHCAALDKAETPIRDLFILFPLKKSADKSVSIFSPTKYVGR